MPRRHLKVPAPGWPRSAEALLGSRRWEDSPEGVPLAGLPVLGRGVKANSTSRDFHCSQDARPCLPGWVRDCLEGGNQCAQGSAHWAAGKELRPWLRQRAEIPWGLEEPQSLLTSWKNSWRARRGEPGVTLSPPEFPLNVKPPSPAIPERNGHIWFFVLFLRGGGEGNSVPGCPWPLSNLALCLALLRAMKVQTGNEWLNPGVGEGQP